MTSPRHPRSALGAVLAGIVLLTGCGTAAERTEVVRVPSPDAALDAVVVQSSAGATTGFGYVVFLPPHGCAVPATPVLRVVDASLNARAAGVHLDWTGPRTLVVSYLDARFTDPASGAATTDTVAGPVTVATRPGIPDADAAPGGMSAQPGPSPTLLTRPPPPGVVDGSADDGDPDDRARHDDRPSVPSSGCRPSSRDERSTAGRSSPAFAQDGDAGQAQTPSSPSMSGALVVVEPVNRTADVDRAGWNRVDAVRLLEAGARASPRGALDG